MARKGTTTAEYEVTRYGTEDQPYLVRYAVREDGSIVRRLGDDGWKLAANAKAAPKFLDRVLKLDGIRKVK